MQAPSEKPRKLPATPSKKAAGSGYSGAERLQPPMPAPRLRPPENAPGDLREGLRAEPAPHKRKIADGRAKFMACYLIATPHNAKLCNRAEKPASYIIGVMRHVFLSFRLHNISRSVCKLRCGQTACQKNTLTILQATFLNDAPAIIPPTPEGELTTVNFFVATTNACPALPMARCDNRKLTRRTG